MEKISIQTKGKDMTAKATPKAKAPKTEKAFNQKISSEYAKLISGASDSNVSAIEFISFMASQSSTQAIQKESMSRLLKDVNVRPVVLPSHVPSLKIAGEIISRYAVSGISKTKASTILSLANRVLMDVHAEGATAHIAQFNTLEGLDEGTKTKAESQADNSQAKPEKEIKIVSVDSIFQKALTDIRKIGKPQELKALDLETLKTFYEVIKVIAKNSITA